MSGWTEITLEIPREHAEKLCDAVFALGALSVAIEDADAGTNDEVAIFGEPGMEPTSIEWAHHRITCLIDPKQDPHYFLKQAAIELAIKPILEFKIRAIPEQDWVSLTQAQFEPMAIGQNIWVVPSWHDAPTPDAIILQLDPGLAFGTGSHSTTRMCMEWLEQHPPIQQHVLDYGCGSGILAILAAKLNATSVTGIDIDPQALLAAKQNSQNNHCAIDFQLPGPLARSSYQVVLANILANPLVSLAPTLAPLLSIEIDQPSYLVLSGILSEQAKMVVDAYAPWLKLDVQCEQDGWVLLAGQRMQ